MTFYRHSGKNEGDGMDWKAKGFNSVLLSRPHSVVNAKVVGHNHWIVSCNDVHIWE